jgi:excisionase family DNA binding protein
VTDREQARLIARAARRALSNWLTEGEAADYLKVSRRTLRAMKGLHIGFVGKRRRYHKASLDAQVVQLPEAAR